MFEKTPPSVPSNDAARFAEESPLRALDWAELTARLNAARDLRRVLQKDASGSGSEFADAAAAFLNARDEHESDVNLIALEQPKGSSDIENAMTGRSSTPEHGPQSDDAREV